MTTMNNTMRRDRPTLRLWLATATVALAAGLAQSAMAAPGDATGDGHRMHRGGDAMGMPMARMGRRALDAVDATAEQRSQIQALMAAAKPEFEQQRAARRALMDQAAVLWSQPTVDARAAETLRQQMLAQHNQASARMMQLALDVSRVLTPAQRQQLAELRARHAAARAGRHGPTGRN